MVAIWVLSPISARKKATAVVRNALPRWVTARPAATAQVRSLDPLGRPLQLVDQGWTIDYLEYAGESPDSPPRKIDVQRGDTRLRLIVDSWNP